MTRQRVLNLYKRILQAGLKWTSKSGLPEDTATEQLYIKTEARNLFRMNKNVKPRIYINETSVIFMKCFEKLVIDNKSRGN